MKERKLAYSVLVLALGLVFLLPVLALGGLALSAEENVWPHLVQTVLWQYLKNSLVLITGVSVLAGVLGVALAWFVTHYQFPFRNFFTWGLVLPFAVPTYLIAYVYTDFLEFAGPVQTGLRSFFDWSNRRDYWFPEIRSLGGAIFLFSLVLYPYVYLLARKAFLEQAASLLEAGALMGCSQKRNFFKLALPLARPSIAVGVSLVMMETLSDFGAVDFFAISTLSLGVYNSWLNMGNLGGAAQLALVTLGFIFFLIVLEKGSRKKEGQYKNSHGYKNKPLRQLPALKRWALCLLAAGPVLLGFVLPVFILLRYTVLNFNSSWNVAFFSYAKNSLFLALGAAALTVLLALFISYLKHRYRLFHQKKGLELFFWESFSLGYALPGTILALGILIPLSNLDHLISEFYYQLLGRELGLLLSGSSFILIFAYLIRFMAIPMGGVADSFQKISDELDHSARLLGVRRMGLLRRLYLPLFQKSLLTGFLIVFVDCMKELPLTLILRPFNFDTLATQVYGYASDELIEKAALAALCIVLVGLVPTTLLSRSIDTSSKASPQLKFVLKKQSPTPNRSTTANSTITTT